MRHDAPTAARPGDVACYFERDVEGESLFPGRGGAGGPVSGGPLPVEHTLIYYLDEEPPEFATRRLTAGLVTVVVVAAVAVLAGVLVLAIPGWKGSGKYEKAETKGLRELRSQLSS